MNNNSSNNIIFFHNFNSLIKIYTETHNNINKIINDKIKYESDNITEKENELLYKYEYISVICSIFFDKIYSLSNDIEKYLNENCQHNWIFDSIDINPDRSVIINYCTNCNTIKNKFKTQ